MTLVIALGLACSNPETPGDSPPATSDTGVEDSPWSPRDDVPGWPDYDCPDPPTGANVITLSYPSPWQFRGVFSAAEMYEGKPGPHYFVVSLRDCVSFECTGNAQEYYDHPYVNATLYDDIAPPGAERGLGEYGPDENESRSIIGGATSVFGTLRNVDVDGSPPTVSATACLSRVRPDELVGAIEMRGDAVALGLGSEYYDEVVFRVPFDVAFADHAGFDDDGQMISMPEDVHAAYYDYYIPFAEAWPWDEIEDDAIRDELMRRYSPYNE